MSYCNGCGGVVGRDCFNPQECEWIAQDMLQRAERDRWDEEEARYYAEMNRQYEEHLASLPGPHITQDGEAAPK